ncbi:hypothetical protein RB980_002111 [Vibrio fluvialis]|nr:hypothetical protein [Vibrio fluvialis]ELE8119504.1 hypothetical protein [Vibrio fluvialis]
MKKIAVLSALVLTASLPVNADQTKDEGWFRDNDNYQKYWANSTNSAFQATMTKIEGNKNYESFIAFRLILNSDYCQDKGKDFSSERTIQVDDQDILFKESCYQNKYLNVYPASREGDDYILKQFASSSGKEVTFVVNYNNAPYELYTFPKKDFSGYYRSAQKSLKERID